MRRMMLGIMLFACFCILGCDSGKNAYEEGRKHTKSGDHEAAIKAYSEAIKSNPKFTDAYIWRASAYTDTQKFANALEDLDKAIQLSPKNSQAYFYRAMVNVTLGKNREGMADFNVACQGGNDQACQAVINMPAIETAKQMELDSQQRAMRLPTYIPGPGAELTKTTKTKKEMMEDGKSALDRGDAGTAFKIYQQVAATGDPVAQTILAMMYMEGKGVPQNVSSAIDWYKKAADQGYPVAQYNLGLRYIEGKIVTQDYRQAAKLMRSAAEKGYGNAQLNLSIMYNDGLGVEKNISEAIKWCQKAANQGIPGAEHNLAILNGK